MDNINIGFSSRLAARFKGVYFSSVAGGIRGDELFEAVLGVAYQACGPHFPAEVEAAALAVHPQSQSI